MLKKRAMSLVASMALLVVLVVPVQAASCSEAQTNVWANTNYDGYGLAICYGSNIPNFGSFAFPGGGTWNDRISSAEFDEKTVNTRACTYTELNYIGNNWSPQSDNSTQWFLGGDVISSFRYVANSASC